MPIHCLHGRRVHRFRVIVVWTCLEISIQRLKWHFPIKSVSSPFHPHLQPRMHPMDTGRTLLSCPGRIQDWLGAAVDQVESLLQVPIPSLSGSDLAIGAARIKLERSSWTTGPYNSHPTILVSSAFATAYQIPPSVSFDRPLCEEKSASRCENCVAEGGQCSRVLPSCTRCHVKEGESGLPSESPLAVSASEDPTVLETHEELAILHCRPDTHPPHAVSEYARSSLERYPTILPICPPMGTSSARGLSNSHYQTAVTKRQVTMLPPTPIPSTLPHGISKLETTYETSRMESESQWPGAVVGGPNPSLTQGA